MTIGCATSQGQGDVAASPWMLGFLGLIVGFVFGFYCGKRFRGQGFSFFDNRIKEVMTESVNDKDSVIFNNIVDLIDTRIKETCVDNSMRGNELQLMVHKYTIDDKMFMASLTGKLKNSLGLDDDESVLTERSAHNNDENSNPEVSSLKYELYAKDSQTKTLSVIDSTYRQGFSIYRLMLPSPDSTFAELDLCLDRDDAKGRILANGDQFLEAVCSITRESSRPTTVVVKKLGRAEKNSLGEWVVVQPVEIELK